MTLGVTSSPLKLLGLGCLHRPASHLLFNVCVEDRRVDLAPVRSDVPGVAGQVLVAPLLGLALRIGTRPFALRSLDGVAAHVGVAEADRKIPEGLGDHARRPGLVP